MYTIERVKDFIRKTIETYYSVMWYNDYKVTNAEIDRYMEIGSTKALEIGSKMYVDFAHIEKCITHVIHQIYDSELNADCLVRMARDFAVTEDEGILRDHEIRRDGILVYPAVTTIWNVESILSSINHDCSNIAERAVMLFTYLEKYDLFTGNTVMLSLMVTNKILLDDGMGIIYIPGKDQAEYHQLKCNFNNNVPGAEHALQRFLMEHIYLTDISVQSVPAKSKVKMFGSIVNSKGEEASVSDHVTLTTTGGWISSGETHEITGFIMNKQDKIVVFDGDINQPVSGIIDFEISIGGSELDDLFGAANKMT